MGVTCLHPQLWQPKHFLTLPNISWETKVPLVENHCSRQTAGIYFSPVSEKGHILPPKPLASGNSLVSVCLSLKAVTLFFRFRGLQLLASAWLTTFKFSPFSFKRCLSWFWDVYNFFLYFSFYLYVLLPIVWYREVVSKSELIELSLLEIFTSVIFIEWSVSILVFQYGNPSKQWIRQEWQVKDSISYCWVMILLYLPSSISLTILTILGLSYECADKPLL